MTDDAPRQPPERPDDDDIKVAGAPLDAERRRLLMGTILGALVTAGVLSPKQAEAQFGFGGGLDLDGLQDLITLLLRVFQIGPQLDIPPAAIGLVNDLLDLLGSAGGNTTLRSASVEGAFEARFPIEPALTRNAQVEATLFQVDAVRQVVVQSQQIQGSLAEQQGELTNQERDLIQGAQAGGDVEGMTVLLQGILAMQGSIAQRLGMISTGIAAMSQIVADQRMAEINEKEQAVRQMQEFMGDDGEEIPPPVFRPAN